MTFPSTPIAHAIAAGTNSATTGAIDSSTANLLPLFVGWYAGITVDVTVSDSKFNTWTSRTRYASADGALAGRFWYAAGSPTVGAGHTFTASGTSTYCNISISAWSGAHATPFDVESGGATTSGSTIATGSITPGQNGSLLITGVVESGSGSLSIDNSFTLSDELPTLGGSYEGAGRAYRVQATAAAINPTWTTSGSGYLVSPIIAFKPSAAGGNTYSESASDSASSSDAATALGAFGAIASDAIVAAAVATSLGAFGAAATDDAAAADAASGIAIFASAASDAAAAADVSAAQETMPLAAADAVAASDLVTLGTPPVAVDAADAVAAVDASTSVVTFLVAAADGIAPGEVVTVVGALGASAVDLVTLGDETLATAIALLFVSDAVALTDVALSFQIGLGDISAARNYTVAAFNRTYTVIARNRTYTVETKGFNFTISPERIQ